MPSGVSIDRRKFACAYAYLVGIWRRTSKFGWGCSGSKTSAAFVAILGGEPGGSVPLFYRAKLIKFIDGAEVTRPTRCFVSSAIDIMMTPLSSGTRATPTRLVRSSLNNNSSITVTERTLYCLLLRSGGAETCTHQLSRLDPALRLVDILPP